MSYSRNFGFRDTTNIVRDGRFQIPSDFDETADGTLFLGTAVVVDTATPGDLTRPSDSQVPDQLCGVLLQEHINLAGLDPALNRAEDRDTATAGDYVQFVHGPSVKVWFKNDTETLVAGMGATPTLAVGDYLTPTVTGTWKAGTSANGWMQVEQIDFDTGVVEARFTF